MITSIKDPNITPDLRRRIYRMFNGQTVKKENGTDTPCWIWQGPQTNGAAVINVGYRGEYVRLYARRFSYETNKGRIPERAIVKVTCGEKLCIQPAHLYVPNIADVERRHANKVPGARLNLAIAREIREMASHGATMTTIARVFGIDRATANRVKNGKSWAEPAEPLGCAPLAC